MSLAARALAPFLPSVYQPADHTNAARPARVGALSHRAVLMANTGHMTAPDTEAWQEGRARQAVIRGQTERLADVLEAAGICTRLPSDMSMLGEVTGSVDQAESWRAIRFLPLVAQRDRRPVISALKLWLRTAKHVRYAVITSGQRVPLGADLKARQSEHTGNIRRWSSEARKRFGVELLLRATEYTVNDQSVNLHSNIAYRLAKPLPKKQWAEFLSWSRGRLQAHWKDCGVLNKPEELVKYCVKPADLERLADPDVVWLYEQTFRSKMVQPLGRFAEWLKGLERDRLKVAMVMCGGKSRLRLVTKIERDPSSGTNTEIGENIICGRTLPQARWCPWSEPVSLVMGYTEHPQTPQGVRRLAVLRSRQVEAREWWDANGGPDPLKVHTVSPTVQVVKSQTATTGTLTLDDGTIIDRDTGEVLYEPPPELLAARQRVSEMATQDFQTVTHATPRKRRVFRTTFDDLDIKALHVLCSA